MLFSRSSVVMAICASALFVASPDSLLVAAQTDSPSPTMMDTDDMNLTSVPASTYPSSMPSSAVPTGSSMPASSGPSSSDAVMDDFNGTSIPPSLAPSMSSEPSSFMPSSMNSIMPSNMTSGMPTMEYSNETDSNETSVEPSSAPTVDSVPDAIPGSANSPESAGSTFSNVFAVFVVTATTALLGAL